MTHTDHHPPNLEAAMSYAKRGWPVFPVFEPGSDGKCSCGRLGCTNPGKHPRTANGFKDATTTEAQICAWWENHPDSNIAVATGQVAGLVAIDIDGREGEKSFVELCSKGEELPETIEQRTGGGGRHLLFRHPGGVIRNGVGRLSPGIDVRADDGYVVVSPSQHASGRSYEWINAPEKMVPSDVPDWLLKMMLGKQGDSQNSKPDDGMPIREGQRNDELTRLAGTMRRPGMTQREIEAALLCVNEERCQPPLEEFEVQRIASSVGNYPPSDVPYVPSACKEGGTTERIELHPISLAELLSRATEEIEWVVDGLLPKSCALMLSAEPHTAKTWALLDLAIAVACGDLWMSRQTTKGKVLIIDEEDSIADLQRRLSQLLKGRKLSVDDVTQGVDLLPLTGINLSDSKYVEALDLLLAKSKPDVVIFDSLVRIHTEDEDKAQPMAKITGILKRLMVTHGCSFVLSHHDRKATGKSRGRPENRFRGSSEIRAFVDSHIDLEPRGQERFLANHVKLKAGHSVDPFEFEVVDTEHGGTILRCLGESTGTPKSKEHEAQSLILEILADKEWHSRKNLNEAGLAKGLKRDRMDTARKSLVTDGKVKDERREKEAGIILVERSVDSDTPKGMEHRNDDEPSAGPNPPTSSEQEASARCSLRVGADK